MSSQIDQRSMYSRSRLDPSVEVRLATRGHLPESGHPRPHGQSTSVPHVVAGHLGRQRRPRPDEAHLAAQDVQQLRQLVERCPAQPPAGSGHPRVVGHLEGVARISFWSRRSSSCCLGAVDHRPELPDLEGRPCRPTRCCRNRIGPRESSLIQTDIATHDGLRTNRERRRRRSRGRVCEQAQRPDPGRAGGSRSGPRRTPRPCPPRSRGQGGTSGCARSCPPPRTGGRCRRSVTTRSSGRQIATSSTTRPWRMSSI